jgi:hypothetical protein
MGCLKITKIFVVENLEKHTVGVPGGAAADEFAVGCTQRVEDGIIEFLVIGYKVEFVSVNHMECWTADGFGVVWKSLDTAAVLEVDLGSLRFESYSCWKVMGEGCYA